MNSFIAGQTKQKFAITTYPASGNAVAEAATIDTANTRISTSTTSLAGSYVGIVPTVAGESSGNIELTFDLTAAGVTPSIGDQLYLHIAGQVDSEGSAWDTRVVPLLIQEVMRGSDNSPTAEEVADEVWDRFGNPDNLVSVQELSSAVTTITTAIGGIATSDATAANQTAILNAIGNFAVIGSGAIEHQVTIQADGTPVAGADVWVSTDEAGTNVVAGKLVTNAFGQVTFMLDAGGYYAWTQKAGVNFTNPTAFTVA